MSRYPEIWKPIPSAPGWLASTMGRLRLPPRKIKMPNGGFKILTVEPTFGFFDKRARRHRQSVNGHSKLVAQLVCEAFHGPRPTRKFQCMHLDENSKNNKSNNLGWGTRRENYTAPKYLQWKSEFMTARWAARRANGEVCNLTKLTAEQVIAIRATTGRNRDIAEAFGISQSCVTIIRSRKTWKHLP